MSATAELLVCADLRDTRYGGYPDLSGDVSVLLVGWMAAADAADTGPLPSCVRDALVRASLAHWCLALLGEPADARTPAPGLSGRLRAPLAWRVVNQADAAAPLFEQPSHPWSLQGQCGLLFRDPPVFGDARLWRLAHRRSALDASLLARLGIEGLLLPGTDGEFVEALFGSGDTRAQWLAALHASATTLGLPVREVNADTFRQTNWFGDR